VRLDRLSDEGTRVELEVLEDGLLELRCVPPVGIGQHGKLVCGRDGNVLWDPLGFVDESAVQAVVAHGDVIAIVASHPHVFGTQVQWSRLLGGPPVYVNAADAAWVMRPDPAIQPWSGTLDLTPSLTVVQVGGHFPGSGVACWRDGASGRGVLLAGDTISPNPDGRTVGFLRAIRIGFRCRPTLSTGWRPPCRRWTSTASMVFSATTSSPTPAAACSIPRPGTAHG